MPQFSYTALTPEGLTIQSQAFASNEQALLDQLLSKQYEVLEVKPYQPLFERFNAPTFSPSERLLFFKQLQSMCASGFTFEQSLEQTYKTLHKPKQQAVVQDILERLRSGQSIYASVSAHENVFGSTFCALMQVAQSSGQMPQVLSDLTEQMEQTQELKNKIITAMTYPMIVCFLSLGMILFLLIYVVPQMTQVLSAHGQTLPALTRSMLWLSGTLQQYWHALAGIFVLSVFVFKKSLTNPATRYRIDRMLLRLPLLGPLITDYQTTLFAKYLSLLTRSGIGLLPALQMIQPLVTNHYLREHLQQAHERITQGVHFAKALCEPDSFNPMLGSFLQLAAKTGHLSNALDNVSSHLHVFLIRKTTRLSTLLEPLLIVIMGAFVLLIVLSVLLPMIQMNQMPL